MTILSLLLCLATVALWVRSYWRFDGLYRPFAGSQSHRQFGMQSVWGELCIFDGDMPGPAESRWWHFSAGTTGASGTLASGTWHGFNSVAVQLPRHHSLRAIGIPHWFPALLFAILPTIRLVKIFRNRHRYRPGLCQHCGYDLRATPGRCPECGHVP